MHPKARSKRKRSELPSTNQMSASSSTAGQPSMFKKAKNVHITGGMFCVNADNGPSLEVLHNRVAPNAILNVGGRADEVRCHPGTREEVIGCIEKWANAQDGQTAPMFWLSGPAGAGKSAIVQTVAERVKKCGAPQANFFFFRGDVSRSHVSPLIATLLHQIILLYPSLRDPVATALSINPLLFDSSLEDQLEQLIITHLRSIQQSSSTYRPPIFLIDGLDECDSETKLSQQQILTAFDKVMAQQRNACLFCLLVASRDESQIRAAFNKMTSDCVHLYLDDKYSPEQDIRVFVTAQFEQVRQAHPLAHTLDVTWPDTKDIDYIVAKSSGQFVYAATVMRFILESSASPLVSLERVKGAAQLATKSPFSYLDAIYTYILSQADDQDTLKDILHTRSSIEGTSKALAVTLSTRCKSTIPLLDLLGLINKRYTGVMTLSCLADITPIARYDLESEKLLFYHASFLDYLSDQSRSKDYFIDMAAFYYRILPVVWQCLIDNKQQKNWWLQYGLCGLLKLQKLPLHLMNRVAQTNFKVAPNHQPRKSDIFQVIYSLCDSDDDIKHFRSFFYNWIDSRDDSDIALDSIKNVPFGRRYYYMTRAHRLGAPDNIMAAALHPETAFDCHELSVWLQDIIFSSRETTLGLTEDYKRLLKSWISWAVENGISCDAFEDLVKYKCM